MRNMRRLCGLLCALLCVLAWFMWRPPSAADVAETAAAPAEAPAPQILPDRVVVQVVDEPQKVEDATPEPVLLRVCDGDGVRQVELEEYLVHVVAGEMPASYESEALRAQAVAARSYIAWKLPAYGGSGCARGGDVCTDSEHCMAYRSDEELRERWGEQYEEYMEKIRAAVRDTAGEVMVYNGSPIQALFHSSSGGRTEDAQAVWGTAYPYLQSVDSADEREERRVKRFAADELAERLNRAFDGAGLTAQNVAAQFDVRARTLSGRADVVKVGKVTATGRAVRAALELSSTNFTIEWEGGEAVITTAGYGHGVGMSQVGANAMAQQGTGYRDILTHYYTGVDIALLSSLGA